MPMPSARPRIGTNAHPAKGKFLVASPAMKDPRFAGTVILLIDYGVRGALGLVVNRPSDIDLSEAFADEKRFKRGDGKLFLGGPVETERVFVLIRSPGGVAGSMPVFKDVYVSESEAALQAAAAGGLEYRVFAGYAGWAPLQLEREIDAGAWEVTDGDADEIFSEKPVARPLK